MFKIASLLSIILIIGGCGYDQKELEASVVACESQNGSVLFSENGTKSIVGVYCDINNVRYRIGRSGKMMDAQLIKKIDRIDLF